LRQARTAIAILTQKTRKLLMVQLSTTPANRRQKLLKTFGSYYGIALIVGGSAIFLFSWMAEEVMESDFTKLSTNILLAIHAHASPIRTQIALFFTDLGSVVGVLICSAFFLGYLFWRKSHLIAYTYIVTLAGSALFVFVLKLAFHQVRPHVFQALVHESNFSFPSGHAVMSFTFWGFFAWYVVSLGHTQLVRWLFAAIFLSIAVCVGLSRLYLGVHWPTDVLAGALIAIFWVSVCTTGHEWMKRRNDQRAEIKKGDTPLTPKPV
jgi:membrane-associated phospholipid phosphatase